MYDLRECFDCRKNYKDCQGYNSRGVYNQEGGIFYESDKRPGPKQNMFQRCWPRLKIR